jgi:uncharacterized protein (DUF1697 family)
MAEFAALLRGVSPLNASMPELKKAFEGAGFKNVRTVLGSGNVLFSANPSSPDAISLRAEAGMRKALGRSFYTIVRRVEALRKLIESDPYAAFTLKPGSKRVVTFLRKRPAPVDLPIEREGARILAVRGADIYSAYLPGPRGPVFMSLLEKTFGKDITTRTWETVGKLTRK